MFHHLQNAIKDFAERFLINANGSISSFAKLLNRLSLDPKAIDHLAAGGIGFIVEPIQNLIARVDVSIPFVNLADRGNNLQESSVFFSLGYRF